MNLNACVKIMTVLSGYNNPVTPPFLDIECVKSFAKNPDYEAAIFFLHGYNGVALDQWAAMEQVGFQIGLQDRVKFIVPITEKTLRNDAAGWFRWSWLPWVSEPGTSNVATEEDLNESMNVVWPLIQEEARLLNNRYDKIFLVGYSQGGMMSHWIGLNAPVTLGAVFNYQACFPRTSVANPFPVQGGRVPIVHMHDPQEEVVPQKYVEAGYRAALAAGAMNYLPVIPITAGHTITEESIHRMRDMIIAMLDGQSIDYLLNEDQLEKPHVVLEQVYYFSQTDDYAAVVLVMHGYRGIALSEWNTIVSMGFDNGLRDRVKFIVPQMNITGGEFDGPGWFPWATVPWAGEAGVSDLAAEEDLKASSDILRAIIDREVWRLNGRYDRIFLVGLSQGGMIATWIGLTANVTLGGILNYQGCFPMSSYDRSLPEKGAKVPVFHLHDPEDEMVPRKYVNAGYQAAIRVGALNYSPVVDLSNPRHHGIYPESVDILRERLIELVNQIE